MFMRFFRVPVNGDQTKAEAEVNRFLGSHRILSVDRQFVSDGVNSFFPDRACRFRIRRGLASGAIASHSSCWEAG